MMVNLSECKFGDILLTRDGGKILFVCKSQPINVFPFECDYEPADEFICISELDESRFEWMTYDICGRNIDVRVPKTRPEKEIVGKWTRHYDTEEYTFGNKFKTSGGEAAGQLAIYIAGSTEAFADMMNEKLAELGCGETSHFTNCVGIYGEDHYSTVYDIAMIMKAAMDNEICRPVLSAHVYTTTVTEQNPEGLICSNWFLRRIEDKMESGEVIGAKTGFVDQAGSCAASYEQSESGRTYICVTASANSSWSCIYDHVDLYKTFAQ